MSHTAGDLSDVNRFHPKRWTVLTWMAVLVWAWLAFPRNYPPSVSYTVDASTGELSDPTHYNSLADIPFSVGWPVQYVRPRNPPPGVYLGGKWVFPPRPPSRVSPAAMVANFLLIASAIAALVYVLQKTKYQYSLLFLCGCISAIPLYLGLGRLVWMLSGYRMGAWYGIAVYFSPIPIAIAVKWSLFPRWNWQRFRPKWTLRPRSTGDYDNPEDAIAAAIRLEKHGDWEASIELYRQAANRWPEHKRYAEECITRIAQRQSLARALAG